MREHCRRWVRRGPSHTGWCGEGSAGQGRDPIPEAGSAGRGGHPEVPLPMPKGAGEAEGALVAWWIFGWQVMLTAKRQWPLVLRDHPLHRSEDRSEVPSSPVRIRVGIR